MGDEQRPFKGRGSSGNPANRYHAAAVEPVDDGWPADDPLPPLRTEVREERCRHIISRNQSPDVPFDRSINPYRGCEHGCIYCYARPTHAWLDLSPGLDFESRLSCKPDAAARLREELADPRYRCAPIALGVNTDAWQPVERERGITRAVLEVLAETRHPVTIVTKSALVERDLDLLQELARHNLVSVAFSITTLDSTLARRMEPRAAAPHRRLAALGRLSRAGIPTGVMLAPVIPFLNDAEIETLLAHCREAGAGHAGYVFVRLPREVAPLFEQWLDTHYPLKAKRILQRIRDSREGRLNQVAFGRRMRGEGHYADLIGRRFERARRRFGYSDPPQLDTSRFRPPLPTSGQMDLFSR